jgi:hypothetical protein
LTIEAYQSRMRSPGRMNYYSTVAKKIGMIITPPAHPKLNYTAWLNKLTWDKNAQIYLRDCCHFHGCRYVRLYVFQ